MQLDTKFNLGDIVVPIRQRYETVGDPCPECEGTGRAALLKGGTVRCPNRECRSGLIHHTAIRPWKPSTDFTSAIGKVDAERYADARQGTSRTTYMIEATGVGSGTLWSEADLFATVEDAQAECDRRNAAAVLSPEEPRAD